MRSLLTILVTLSSLGSALVPLTAAMNQVPPPKNVAAPVSPAARLLFFANSGQPGPGRQTGPDTLYSLRANSGALIWKKSFGTATYSVYSRGGTYSTPGDYSTLSSNVIYVAGCDIAKKVLCVSALRASDGSVLWQSILPDPYPSFDFTINKPLVADGNVYVFFDHTLYALQASDGKLLWEPHMETLASAGAAIGSYDAGHGLLFMEYLDGTCDSCEYAGHNIVALRATDGSLAWHSPIATYTENIVLEGDTLYGHTYQRNADQGGSIVALQASTGALKWRSAFSQVYIYSLTASPEHVYVRASGRDDQVNGASVFTLDAHSGRLLWQIKVDPWYGGDTVEANGIAYVTDKGVLYALRAGDGKLLWQYREPAPYYNYVSFDAPIVSGETVFVASSLQFTRDLTLLPKFCLGDCHPPVGISALRTSDGKPYWHYEIPDLATDVGHVLMLTQ